MKLYREDLLYWYVYNCGVVGERLQDKSAILTGQNSDYATYVGNLQSEFKLIVTHLIKGHMIFGRRSINTTTNLGLRQLNSCN
jgi:hypothetical protein